MFTHFRSLRRSTIVLHTRDGQSFRGVLVGDYRDCVVLANAVLLADEGVADLAGSIGVPRSNVAWWQEHLP